MRFRSVALPSICRAERRLPVASCADGKAIDEPNSQPLIWNERDGVSGFEPRPVHMNQAEERRRLSRQITYGINRYRRSRSIEPLKHSPALQGSARAFALTLHRQHRFSHDPTIHAPKRFHWLGECLASGYVANWAVIDGWMHSDGHRAILLSESYRWMGCARVGNLWVAHFGRLR